MILWVNDGVRRFHGYSTCCPLVDFKNLLLDAFLAFLLLAMVQYDILGLRLKIAQNCICKLLHER